MITSETSGWREPRGCNCATIQSSSPSSRDWSNGRSSCSVGSSSGSWSCRRNPDHRDAPSPEVSGAPDRGRSPRDALRAGGQSVGQGRRPGHRRGQRARAARTAVGRPVLLGSGPQASARQPGAGAGRRGVPRRTRLARCQGGPPRGAGSLAGAVGARRASDLAARAGLLCKADLVTGMVGEFPELQGIMGRHYAYHDRERPEVADAIAEHYGPRARTTAVRARPPASPWRSPTSWTRSSASSRSARSRPARGSLRLAPRRARRHPADPGKSAPAVASRRVRAGPGPLRRSAARHRCRCASAELLASSPTG